MHCRMSVILPLCLCSKVGDGRWCRVANGLGVHVNSKVAKRVQRPVKRIDGADEDELKELLGDEGEVDLTAAPKRRGSAGRRPENPAPKPPHYIPVQLS